jgi:hypothetical protein
MQISFWAYGRPVFQQAGPKRPSYLLSFARSGSSAGSYRFDLSEISEFVGPLRKFLPAFVQANSLRMPFSPGEY